MPTVLLLAVFVASVFQSSATVQVTLGKNFIGSTYLSDTAATPPDSDGAIGPSHFVEFINGRFSVFDKSSGAKVQTRTDTGFWNAAGVTFGAGITVSDPRIIFDRATQRWFASQIDFNPNNLKNNRFLLAISATNDPTGTWNAVAFQADASGNFADFPMLGLNATGVYLGANMFAPGGSFAGVSLTSIPKADLLLSTPTATNRTTTGILAVSDHGFSLQSVVNFDPSNTVETILATDSNGTDFLPHFTLKSFQVQNASTPAATFTGNIDIAVPEFDVPINPTQPTGINTLDDGDSRISALVYQVGNIIYAVHGTQINSNAAVQWFKVDATTDTLIDSGTISDPILEFFYPSIAANEFGYVVIAFSGCSTNTFVSSYAVVGETINGALTFGNPIQLKRGLSTYEVLSGGTSRWGDYSATSVDPTNPFRFWTIQQFTSSHNVWSTQISEIRLAPVLPPLQITAAGGSALVSWPTNGADGFVLYSAPTVVGGTWSPVTNSVTMTGGTNFVTVDATSLQQYFRLRR
jgi:hypothetical protein